MFDMLSLLIYFVTSTKYWCNPLPDKLSAKDRSFSMRSSTYST